jgi:hypothetical protein
MCARLNCIRHLLSLIPYEDLTPEPIVLPPRQREEGYVRPPITDQTFVPQVYAYDEKRKKDKPKEKVAEPEGQPAAS